MYMYPISLLKPIELLNEYELEYMEILYMYMIGNVQKKYPDSMDKEVF